MSAPQEFLRDDGFDEMFDESSGEDVPAPVSSLAHVSRATSAAESLVPPSPFWAFSARRAQHRETGR